MDRLALGRLAAATGGKVLDPARPDTWPSPDGTAELAEARPYTLDLWDSFILLLALCGLLAADWFLRLFKGLV